MAKKKKSNAKAVAATPAQIAARTKAAERMRRAARLRKSGETMAQALKRLKTT